MKSPRKYQRQGRNQLFISGLGNFMNFQSMTSSCLFNRGTTSSQTVTDCYFRNISENENLLVLIKPVARGG